MKKLIAVFDFSHGYKETQHTLETTETIKKLSKTGCFDSVVLLVVADEDKQIIPKDLRSCSDVVYNFISDVPTDLYSDLVMRSDDVYLVGVGVDSLILQVAYAIKGRCHSVTLISSCVASLNGIKGCNSGIHCLEVLLGKENIIGGMLDNVLSELKKVV
jgi:hypothetical protein